MTFLFGIVAMAGKSKKGKLISRLIKAPIRILAGARDFYVRSLSECSGHMAMVCPAGQVLTTLPRSFSVSSSRSHVSSGDEDFQELVRAASTRSLSSMLKKQEPPHTNKIPRAAQFYGQRSPNMGPRSFSTGMGRIDEENPIEFGEGIEVRTGPLYPRSRSCAANRRSAGLP